MSPLLPHAAAPLRTVVVDDDPAVATLHRRFVESHPAFTVVAVVADGPSAVRAVADLEPDLVLLDFYLPGMSGLEVLRDVRSSVGFQPEVIAVTAAHDVDSVRMARGFGVHHYLVKPFTAQNLRGRLDDVADSVRLLAGSAPPDGLAQSVIDRVMEGGGRRQVLPKGLSTETLGTVVSALRDCPGASATEIGDRAGISRVSSRRYLEYLVLCSRVERTLDYATAGRPSSRYRLRQAPAGVSPEPVPRGKP